MHNFSPYSAVLAWMGTLSFAFAYDPGDAGVRLTNSITIQANIGRPADVEFSPDGKFLAAGGFFVSRGDGDVIQGSLGVWDLETLKRTEVRFRDLPADFRPQVRDFPFLNFRSVAFSPDGRLLATGIGGYKPENGTTFTGTVILFEAKTGERKAVLSGHSDQVTSVKFHPAGRLLASAGADNSIRLWDVREGKLKATLSGHTEGIQQIRFSIEGSLLASAGGRDKTVRIWAAKAGKEIAVLEHDEFVSAVAISPDGKTIASSGHDPRNRTGDHIRLWHRGTEKLKTRLPDHKGDIRDIAFSPDGKLLVSVGGKPLVRRLRENSGGPGELKLWNAASGKELASVETEDQFTSVAFSPNGKRLAAGNLDGTIRLWDLAQPQNGDSR